VAEMDFPLAPQVAQVLSEAIRRSDTGYPATRELGDALAEFAARRWSWCIEPEAVRAAPDVGVAVVELLRVLTRPGDMVAINTPVYAPFFDWIPEARAKVLEVPLAIGASGWRLDLDRLEAAFARHPSVYLLCNPHNPVGRVHSPAELEAVVRLAERHDVTILSDEIHAPLMLDGSAFTPMLTVPGAAGRTISALSASKAWNLAGLKCAMTVTGSPNMASMVEQAHQVALRAGHFGVMATIAALTGGDAWLDRLLSTLSHRRDQLDALLADRLPMIRWHPPEATYLAWLDCRAIGSGSSPCDRFLERGRVALAPGPRFGAEGTGHVRLNFATSPELLEEAIDRMARALSP
jgi:cystathionine beta-lyase